MDAARSSSTLQKQITLVLSPSTGIFWGISFTITNTKINYLLTYFMENSPSWEANQLSAGQEIPHIFWNPKAHYCFHKCPLLSLSSVSLIQSIPPHPAYLRAILLLLTHLHLGLPSGTFPPGSPPKTCICLSSPPYLLHARSSHSSRFDQLNNTGWGVQIIKLLIM